MIQQMIIDIREYLRRNWSVSRIMFALDCSYDDVLYVREIEENLVEAQEFLDTLPSEPRAVIRERCRELVESYERHLVDPKGASL